MKSKIFALLRTFAYSLFCLLPLACSHAPPVAPPPTPVMPSVQPQTHAVAALQASLERMAELLAEQNDLRQLPVKERAMKLAHLREQLMQDRANLSGRDNDTDVLCCLEKSLRYVLALSLSGNSLEQQRQALQLLEDLQADLASSTENELVDWFDSATSPMLLESSPLLEPAPAMRLSGLVWQPLLQLLHTELQQRLRLEEQLQNASSKLRDEIYLRQEATQENKRLQQKLEALIDIERRLLRREPGNGGTQ